MSPALSWLLVCAVVSAFAYIGYRILNWIDDLRFHRRYIRPAQPRPYDREKDAA